MHQSWQGRDWSSLWRTRFQKCGYFIRRHTLPAYYGAIPLLWGTLGWVGAGGYPVHLHASDSGTLGSSTERFRVGSGNQEPAASERNEKTQQETCVTTHVSVISFAGSENHSVDEFVAIIAILARAHRHSHQIIGEGGVHSEAVGVPPTQIGVARRVSGFIPVDSPAPYGCEPCGYTIGGMPQGMRYRL